MLLVLFLGAFAISSADVEVMRSEGQKLRREAEPVASTGNTLAAVRSHGQSVVQKTASMSEGVKLAQENPGPAGPPGDQPAPMPGPPGIAGLSGLPGLQGDA